MGHGSLCRLRFHVLPCSWGRQAGGVQVVTVSKSGSCREWVMVFVNWMREASEGGPGKENNIARSAGFCLPSKAGDRGDWLG